MIFLKNDYSLGAHPTVFEALAKTNMDLTDGYGMDGHCFSAAENIRKLIACPGADVHFFVGGTQTNLTALSSFLRPHHSIISADTGHICVHETGAVEATGHKANNVLTKEGKLSPSDINDVMLFHENEHYVKPRMVYISDSTETGLVYSRGELAALRQSCDEHGLLLYIDGARLAMALTADSNDLSFEDLPKFADAFYIGGTKCGALFGEALVIVNDSLKEDFRYLQKQRGAMLAKGRLLGVQFNALLSDGLYLRLGKHANRMAALLADGISSKGYGFAIRPETNMIFPLFPNELISELEKNVMFEGWPYSTGTHHAVRLVTSWGTSEDEIESFLRLI